LPPRDADNRALSAGAGARGAHAAGVVARPDRTYRRAAGTPGL